MMRLYAVAQPGLEPFLQAELRELGIKALQPLRYTASGDAYEESGGLEFEGDLADLYRVNLHSRIANRVLARLGEFNAAGFEELRKKAARLKWDDYIKPGQPVSFRVTCRKSRLYHSDAVAREVWSAINSQMSKPCPLVKYDEDDSHLSALVVIRLLHDVCTISMDSSGASLHRRGYRLETAKAPLRETLAAGLLLASGWDAASPLLDPFCGSGTIAVEAALYARHIPPGRNRRFTFSHWPIFDSPLWQKIYTEALANEVQACPVIQASDRDEGAVRITRANAERAGVAANLQVEHRPFSAMEPPAGPGWVVTNPPYGLRVSPDRDLRDLYDKLGDILRQKCQGWHIHLLCGDPVLAGHTRLSFQKPMLLRNGGLLVGFYSTKG